jgi:serine protease inhibitor
MTRRTSFAQFFFGARLAAAQQGAKLQEVDWQTRRAWADKSKVAVAGLNQFGLKLARELARKRPGENIFISPLSVFLALAMTGNGAAGETKSAMWRTLGLPADLMDGALNEAAQSLTKLLESEKGVQLSIANALWASLAFHFGEEFAKRCVAAYGAKVTTLDFTRQEATDKINGWVKEKTMGMIPSIVNRDTVMATSVILTNAVYFRGKWKRPFAKPLTQTKPFHVTGERTKDVPIMQHTNLAMAYRDGIEFESAELAYEGSEIRMQVLLPKAGRSAKDVLEKLGWEWLHNVPASADLDLSLPRFTMNFSEMLSAALKQMGMQIAFQYPGANFTPMGSKLFYIGEVIHKARLEVDEEGTIAAATTSIAMRVGSAMPVKREKKTLVFDRPFVLLIYENTTGALLFAGLVQEP